MTDSFVPSMREYAAQYQIDGRRLGARQVLMHPGPVNRGVELAAEVIDSPQAVIGQQVAAGVVVRMAVLYELLAGRTAPDRGGITVGAPRMSRLDHRAQRPADLLIRGAHVLDPREGIDAPHDVLVRDGEIAEIGEPGRARGARRRRGPRRRGPPSVPRLRGPARAPAHARARSTRRTSTPAPAPPPPAATSRSSRCRTPTRRSTPRRCCARLREAARREARIPVGFMASITRGLDGEALTEMAELADAGALGFTDDGKPVHRAGILRKALQYQRLAGADPVPARGGPDALRPRRHARGRGLRAARAGRHPEHLRVDADRPRRLAGRLRGRPDPHPAPERARVGRGDRRGQGARRADHRRGVARTTSRSRTRRCSSGSTRG